ncbi:EscF/YscF/HrpA family type III secretion system needle major subunit [Mesorhizobium sp. M0983]|uniref:EscF/YscF/HrpA family type III secretion system needle major subunit n=1 Tax=Mesorhizobium sp. M0983 TaxID=2957040 RepID=UPI003338DC61
MSRISGPNLNASSITSNIGSATVSAERNFSSLMTSMDPDNASDLLKVQSIGQQWALSLALESSVIRMIYDALKGVLQKIN